MMEMRVMVEMMNLNGGNLHRFLYSLHRGGKFANAPD